MKHAPPNSHDPAISPGDTRLRNLRRVPRRDVRRKRLPSAAAAGLFVVLLVCLPGRGSAQDFGADGIRVGVGVAGTGLVSLLVEYRWGNTGLEGAISTISFKDLGLYGGVRQYLGAASPQPYMGLGLWGLVAGDGERSGGALVLRAPIGVDVTIEDAHSLGFNIALNKALVVRRPDPADTEGPNPRLVPLPALEYRYWTY